jgi:hypothetical protein
LPDVERRGLTLAGVVARGPQVPGFRLELQVHHGREAALERRHPPQSTCAGGRKTVLWSDDGNNDDHALRSGDLPCTTP